MSKYIVVYSSFGLLTDCEVGDEVEVSDPNDAKKLLDRGLIKPVEEDDSQDDDFDDGPDLTPHDELDEDEDDQE